MCIIKNYAWILLFVPKYAHTLVSFFRMPLNVPHQKPPSSQNVPLANRHTVSAPTPAQTPSGLISSIELALPVLEPHTHGPNPHGAFVSGPRLSVSGTCPRCVNCLLLFTAE